MHFPLEHTFNTTLGLVLLAARKAHRATRSPAALNNEPTFERYVHRWLQELKALVTWEPLKGHHGAVQKFFNSLMHFIQEGTFKAMQINWCTRRVHDTQPSPHNNPKQQTRNERKAIVAQQVIVIPQFYLAEGWHIFHFDTSTKYYPKAGWVGGFGSCHQGHWEFSSPLDALKKQTNNRAELKAAISAVVKVTQKTVIFGDSTCVLDAVAGKAYTWRRLQWCLPTVPVRNSELWEALLLAIDMAQYVIRWAWSPSHQGIRGNERADAPAEKGRQNHPLLRYPPPHKQEISHTPSSAAPIKGRAQPLFDCDSDLEAPVALTLFNTPSQATSDDQEIDDFPMTHSVVGSLLGAPCPFVTPPHLVVWSALGLEPMSDTLLPSGDKEALSSTSQPMYLRTSALRDREPLDTVERCLFADSDECSTDASETRKARKKRAKLKGRRPPQ